MSDIDRSPVSAIPAEYLDAVQKGTMRYTYKGVNCLKNPFDIALYLQLIWEVKPRTIFEIGSFDGGSALFLADMCTMMGLETNILSVDIEPRTRPQDDRIQFFVSDAHELEKLFSEEKMKSLPRPFLIIEDGNHNYDLSISVLNFFEKWLEPGEYICVEDGIADTFSVEERYDGGPNRAIKEFLTETSGDFEIDKKYCDYFGYNVTWNTNGYLRRVARTAKSPNLQHSVREHRYGDGSARILSVRLEDVEGKSVSQAVTGENYTLVVDIEGYTKDCETVLGFLMRNDRGVDVYGTDTLKNPGAEIIILQPGDRFRLKVDFHNALMPGQYYITVGLAAPDETKYDMRFDAFALPVISTKTGTGITDLEASFAWNRSVE
tara:strand:+ start:4251 stop:5381 length:1131 start_codon:yes stop_codon:yes gene_type:complete